MEYFHKDSRVDAYINKLPTWQQIICQKVRESAHHADPHITETIKRSVQPYFVLDGNVCALLAAKDHVNVFIYDPIVADPTGLINQGQGNATAQSIQIKENEPIDYDALSDLLRAVVAHNKVGGWRAVQKKL